MELQRIEALRKETLETLAIISELQDDDFAKASTYVRGILSGLDAALEILRGE